MSVHEFADLRRVVSAAISTGASGLSGVVDLGGCRLTGIRMSTGWTAAAMTFAVSADGTTGTLRNLYGTTGNEIQVTTTAGRYVALDPRLYRGIRYLAVRSGIGSSAIAQSTGRTIALVVTPRG